MKSFPTLRNRVRTSACLSLVLAGVFHGAFAAAADWPSWRGPSQTGVSCETGLPSSKDEVLWRAPFGARSTPAIHNGRLFMINLAGQGVMEQERVMALDLATGKPVWEHRFSVFHTDIPNSRVGWANVAVDPETGNVYAHGVQGLFFCYGRDGKILWSRSLTEEYGRISGYGGRIHTPMIDEDRVVIGFLNSSFGNQAKGGHRYLAMDKRTGETRWWSEPGGQPTDTTYAVPVVAVIDGQRLLISGNADGNIYAIKSRTGEKVWGFRFCKSGINASVVVDGDRVYVSHGEENYDTTTMGRVVCINGRGSGDITQTNELWRHDGIEASYASPLIHNGRLYVMNNFGVLHCLDAADGRKIWEHIVGRVGKGSPVWADGKIYATVVNGVFTILEDAGKEARVLDTMSFGSGSEGSIELFGSPAVADGRVVFFTTTEAVCLGRKDAQPSESKAPAMPAEAPADPSAKPAHLQVHPAEVLIKPGQEVRFRAVAFDAKGLELGPVEPQWSCEPPGGEVDSQGNYRAPAKGGIATVNARLGDLTASARVRFVPELPIAEDFESYAQGQGPAWWIGVSKAKHTTEVVQGSKALKKLADDRGPMFNRSTVFITPPLAPGYTIEADVMGVKQGRKRGDVGLINDRYRLEMFGRAKRMRIVSWVPGPRFETRLENFTWDPDRWYRVKFHVDVRDGKATVRAKAWPRGEAEPSAWMLEGVDPQPNLEGSAGLYAYSDAPLYYDNIRIYREEGKK
ncbi:MAG: PQQ-binding-like beta-propeller repeat protein [Pirellulales bacterium]|nr:PQQ-binding-like beta-propeller repeat protein [Pirellulales bacterium]